MKNRIWIWNKTWKDSLRQIYAWEKNISGYPQGSLWAEITVQGPELMWQSDPATKVLKTPLQFWRTWSYSWVFHKNVIPAAPALLCSALRHRLQISLIPKQPYLYFEKDTLNKLNSLQQKNNIHLDCQE